MEYPLRSLLISIQLFFLLFLPVAGSAGECLVKGQSPAQISYRDKIVPLPFMAEDCGSIAVKTGDVSIIYKDKHHQLREFKMGAGESVKHMLLEIAKDSAKKLNWMPLELECLYGDEIHKKNIEKKLVYVKENSSPKITKLYKKAETLLDDVLSSFPKEHPYKFKVFITTMSDVKAEAIPGGILYVSKLSLKDKYKNLTAFALAHEISHVLKRHTTKQFQATLIDSVTSMEQLKDLISANTEHNQKISSISEGIGRMDNLFVSYQINQEHQADVCAVQLLHSNDKFLMVDGIEMFLKREKEDSGCEGEQRGSHPKYPERRRVLLEATKKITLQ